jgi:hypothetical protein
MLFGMLVFNLIFIIWTTWMSSIFFLERSRKTCQFLVLIESIGRAIRLALVMEIYLHCGNTWTSPLETLFASFTGGRHVFKKLKVVMYEKSYWRS